MANGFLTPMPGPPMTAQQAETAKALWAAIGPLRAHDGVRLLRQSLVEDSTAARNVTLFVRTESDARTCKNTEHSALVVERLLTWLAQLDNEVRAKDWTPADVSGEIPDTKEEAHQWATRAAAMTGLANSGAWRDLSLLLMGVAFGYADATGIIGPSEVPACNAVREAIERLVERMNEWIARGVDAAGWLDERAREEGTEESQDG